MGGSRGTGPWHRIWTGSSALAGLTGHLSVLPGESEVEGDASVQAVAESYGPADLAGVVADATARRPGADGSRTPEARLIGGSPAEHPELARQAGPLHWVHPGAPPFQISHGTGDVLASYRQSERLHEALVAAGGTSELYLLEGYKHGFLNPAGRLDVDLADVMDDGRLTAEETARAVFRTSDDPSAASHDTTFGLTDVEAFLRRHLDPYSA